MELYELTITEAHEKLKTKAISSLELTRSVLDRIDQVEPKVEAYITLTPESALKQACQADEAIAQGRIGSLTGIPIGIKDLISTRGIKTTCASRILENYIPPFNATVMSRLQE
jgi:aspartyl-tRNA(Asn)/glutamyl-tRNA(Gln) amidotransferase subunit A